MKYNKCAAIGKTVFRDNKVFEIFIMEDGTNFTNLNHSKFKGIATFCGPSLNFVSMEYTGYDESGNIIYQNISNKRIIWKEVN